MRVYKPIYKRGDYKVRCDATGATFNASDCAMQWDGAFVYKGVWKPRQPQELPVKFTDTQRPNVPRPTQSPAPLLGGADFGYDFSTDFASLNASALGII